LFDEFLVYFFQIDPPGHDGVKKYRLVNLREILRGLVVFIRVLLGEVCYDDVLKKIILAQCTMFIILSKDAVGLSMSQSFSCSVKTYITLMCWLDESSMSAIRKGDGS
jgi:hypothetical protein